MADPSHRRSAPGKKGPFVVSVRLDTSSVRVTRAKVRRRSALGRAVQPFPQHTTAYHTQRRFNRQTRYRMGSQRRTTGR